MASSVAPPSASTSAAPALRDHRLDPRATLLLLLTTSVVVTTPQGLRFVPAGLLLATGLAAWEGARVRAVAVPILGAVLYVLGWVAPSWSDHPVVEIAGLAASYTIRFLVTVALGAHVVATTSPTGLYAALCAWRAPRAISVTLAVMLRFFPVVASESRAVLDAMRLRGLVGAAGVARHPLLSAERFTVPMIAASLRASEDLSASAILRGLGSHHRPVAMDPQRFERPDLTLLAATLVLVVATLLLPTPLGPRT